MQDLTTPVEKLILELRTRLSQLDSVKEDDFLRITEELGRWIFERSEFEESIVYLDKALQNQRAVITDIGRELEDLLKKEWADIISYKFDIADLDELGQIYFQTLNDTFEDKRSLSLMDAYHYIRLINTQLYQIDSIKVKMTANKKVMVTDNGEIKDFVPLVLWNAWNEVENANSLYGDENDNNVIGTITHLRQLTLFKSEYEWRNQYKSWREIYGKSYYLPRLQCLSNFFYDFYVLGVKPDFNTGTESKLEVKGVKYEYHDSQLRVKPDYGTIFFDPSKSKDGKHLMGKFIQIIIGNAGGVDAKTFSKENQELDFNTAATYRSKLNQRFEEEWEKGNLKLFLFIDSVKISTKEPTKYILRAYHFILTKK